MARIGFIATCLAVLLWPVALGLAVKWEPVAWLFLAAAAIATFFAVFDRR